MNLPLLQIEQKPNNVSTGTSHAQKKSFESLLTILTP